MHTGHDDWPRRTQSSCRHRGGVFAPVGILSIGVNGPQPQSPRPELDAPEVQPKTLDRLSRTLNTKVGTWKTGDNHSFIVSVCISEPERRA